MTSRSIGETLAFCVLQVDRHTANVINAKRLTIAVAEIKFRQIAMQVFLTAMLINTLHAALEDAEKAFDGIG